MRLFTTFRRKKRINAQPRRMSSAAVLLENDAHELLVVKANYKDYWTVPGGIVEQNETPKQAAVRETSEEVGVTLDPQNLTFVAVANRASDAAQTYQFIFKAPMPADAAKTIALQTSEIDAYAFVSKSRVLSGDRRYAQAIYNWANGTTGYLEQTFNKET